jgi:cellobiose-specific phosphotransferase system component IIA
MARKKQQTPEEKHFAQIEAAWLDADNNYYLDMKRTRSEAQAMAIDRNWGEARAAYLRALADGLARNTKEVEHAYAVLKEANKEVKLARSNSEVLSRLIKKLEKATKAAMRFALIAA